MNYRKNAANEPGSQIHCFYCRKIAGQRGFCVVISPGIESAIFATGTWHVFLIHVVQVLQTDKNL
jgi:hypothetical protein